MLIAFSFLSSDGIAVRVVVLPVGSPILAVPSPSYPSQRLNAIRNKVRAYYRDRMDTMNV